MECKWALVLRNPGHTIMNRLLYFQRLHEGVIRDLERQSRKLENIRLLQEQITLTKQLEAERDKILMEKGSPQS